MEDWQKNNPFTELGTVEDIGEVVALLSSDSARYINASEFVAAGGTLLQVLAQLRSRDSHILNGLF